MDLGFSKRVHHDQLQGDSYIKQGVWGGTVSGTKIKKYLFICFKTKIINVELFHAQYLSRAVGISDSHE